MDFVIEKVIDGVLEASGLKETVGRNERVIRLLRRFNLDDPTSLTRFDDLYAYALVEYAFDEAGRCKPELLVQFFKAKDVRDVFRTAYAQNSPQGWLRKGEEIAQFKLGTSLPELNPKRELATFAAIFVQLVKQTRSPKEIRQEQKLEGMQRSLQAMQSQLQQLPSLEAINQQIAQLAGQGTPALPTAAATSRAVDLARQLGEWFDVLDYDRDPDYEVWTADTFEWIINFPLTRRRFARILVRGVAGEVDLADLQNFHQAIARTGTDEGWLVGNRRVSKAARTAAQSDATYADITCYTFDELLDEDADFSKYLDWLAADIQAKAVDTDYLPLACRKDELDPVTQQKIGVSLYDEADGWIDGYVDQWLDDPAKEHLSVLGEFGTGKTWFALHYAWVALQRYQDAKKRGIERPRVPIVVPLRDYAKAVTVESLFSEFFFRKHEILKTYSVFEQLNRMGKLLLIFDGFDEMAARVNRQAMIDNFWELAKVVVPGAKAILTCRTEHFPDAIEGRQLLNADLKASTANLTGEPPQFEVLELEKFTDPQIAALLGRKAQTSTVQAVMANAQLLDLARRPVMVDLILEALPEIEAGKPVDMARVYLYAVTAKMERDIKSDRTFTSLADKLYFLCELSWEMLSSDRMSLNYRAFPERLQGLFGDRVKEERELDHWRYDMMGQTMLIRNSEGDYSPAHRSLLEFFVAYKIVASLGAMAEDFTELARQQSYLDGAAAPQGYTWEGYFRRQCDADGVPAVMAPLGEFETMDFDALLPLLRGAKLAKAVLDLAHPMLDGAVMRERLLPVLWGTRDRTAKAVGYLGGNVAQLMLAQSPYALEDSDLSRTKLQGIDFTETYLRRVRLKDAHIADALVSKTIGSVDSLVFSPKGDHLAIGDSKGILQIWEVATGKVVLFCIGHFDWIWSVAFSPDGHTLASSSGDRTVRLWSVSSSDCILTFEGHLGGVRSIAFSPDGRVLISGSADNVVKLWSVVSGKCLHSLKGHSDEVRSVAISPDGKTLATGSYDKTTKLWSMTTKNCIQTIRSHSGRVRSVAFSSDGKTLAISTDSQKVKLWSTDSEDYIQTLEGHLGGVRSVAFSPDGKTLATGSDDQKVKLWLTDSGDCIQTLEGHFDWVRSVAFSPNGETLATGSYDQRIKLWSIASSACVQNFKGHFGWILSLAFSPNGDVLAAGSGNNTLKLWSIAGGNCIHTFTGHHNWVRAVAFSPDGQVLVSGSYDHTIKLWSTSNKSCISTLKGHSDGIRCVAVSPDSQILASGSADRTVKLWSMSSGDCLFTLKEHLNKILSVAFNPSKEILATSSYDQSIMLWSVRTGSCLCTLKDHNDWVRTVGFSPDGEILASGSADNTIKLWSSNSGKCICTLKGHQSTVWSVAFSPDGELLASGSADNTVKLWSLSSGKCINTIGGHGNTIRSVAFSPNGETIASGSGDETIKLWNVKTGKCLQTIDDRVCAGMDITGAVGLTAGQRTALKLMGAVDGSEGVMGWMSGWVNGWMDECGF